MTPIPEYLYRFDKLRRFNQEFEDYFIEDIYETGNTDIWKYLHDHVLKNHPIYHEYNYAETIHRIQTYRGLESMTYWKELGRRVRIALEETVGHPVKSCLWLAPKETVKRYYADGARELMRVKTSDLILSDLGSEILFGYESPEHIVMEPCHEE